LHLVFCSIFLGCSSAGNSPTLKHSELGYTCLSDSQCGSSEFCTNIGDYRLGDRFVCSKYCTADADCPVPYSGANPLQCGILADGSKGCIRECIGLGVACINGVPTACKATDDSHCDQCGCPDGLRCNTNGSVSCVPKLSEGEVCATDGDCLSDNCSPTNKTCRVAVGSPCTSDNCDRCAGNAATGWSYCSRLCGYSSQCNAGDCLISDVYNNGPKYCYPYCVSGCTKCFTATGSTMQYCEI